MKTGNTVLRDPTERTVHFASMEPGHENREYSSLVS